MRQSSLNIFLISERQQLRRWAKIQDLSIVCVLAASTSTTTAEIQYLDLMTGIKMQIQVESESARERVRRGEKRVK